jgi:glycosyltransferase involved in cell wall biosynthesis
VFVVSNPIDSAFEQGALQIPIERSTSAILSLATMSRDKGVLDIMAAANLVREEMSDFEIILAGPEREPGILEVVKGRIAADSLENQILLHPGVWGAAKVEMFRNTSIMLLPSYIENFPLVVLEAAAAGQAIITTPLGAVPEFFEDGVSALFIEPGNPRQIADDILRLLNHPEERIRLGAAARQVFESRLGRSGIMSSLDRVYSHILWPKVIETNDSEVDFVSVRTDGQSRAQ